jgi:hypothetical protein
MVNKLIMTVTGTLFVASFAAAVEIDAVVDDGTRFATKSAKAPEKFFYGKLWLDSKGKLVIQINLEGRVTKETKVATGTFDEKKKKWVAGEPIEGGIGADLFKDTGKVLRVRVTLADDNKSINQILVTKTDEKLEHADGEFDAIWKYRGMLTNGRGGVSFMRVELDEKGKVINYFPVTTTIVTKETKVAMGKYNEKEDTWEAGEEIRNGLYSDIFQDPGAKNIYVRITYRADGRGIAQILVREVGEKGKK